jgi:hypothetical protein
LIDRKDKSSYGSGVGPFPQSKGDDHVPEVEFFAIAADDSRKKDLTGVEGAALKLSRLTEGSIKVEEMVVEYGIIGLELSMECFLFQTENLLIKLDRRA